MTQSKIERLQAEKEKHKAKISKLQVRVQDIDKLILEAENIEIVSLVRSMKLLPEELATLIRGLREKSEVPVFHGERKPYAQQVAPEEQVMREAQEAKDNEESYDDEDE